MINRIAVFLALLLACCAHAELEVHFLDVGQGDAALLLCEGEAMLIDGGPSGASQFIYSYVRQHTDSLDYIVATHPHEDHVGGVGRGSERRARRFDSEPGGGMGREGFPGCPAICPNAADAGGSSL